MATSASTSCTPNFRSRRRLRSRITRAGVMKAARPRKIAGTGFIVATPTSSPTVSVLRSERNKTCCGVMVRYMASRVRVAPTTYFSS